MDKNIKTKYGLSEKQLKRILIARQRKVIKPITLQLGKGKEYTFGAIADTHLCSQKEKLGELHAFYKLCKQRGIKDVYHAGDMVAGQGVYRGQEYEVHTFGADNQVNYFVKNYPKIDGITTHFIGGNHDYSYWMQIGVDICQGIADKRPDMDYLGMFQGDVYVNNVKLIRLVHPDGGMPYALSYRAQKLVEQIYSGEKPRILLLGHLHTNYNFFYRNIAVFGCGCFEGQTTLILRKGINPVIGGYIITIKLGQDKKQSTLSVMSEFVPFFL